MAEPITGIGGCCARAASGHAAAPPSSVAKTSAAHDRLVQKIALTAIVDQADNSTEGDGCWPSRLVATAEGDRLSTTIWSGGAAAGLYLGTGLISAFLVHTHYPGALGLHEWIRVVLSCHSFSS
jgi:hypothetical protein